MDELQKTRREVANAVKVARAELGVPIHVQGTQRLFELKAPKFSGSYSE